MKQLFPLPSALLSISLCNNLPVECSDWGCNVQPTNHLDFLLD